MLTKDELPECPVATTVQLIGNKWKLLILRNLMYDSKPSFFGRRQTRRKRSFRGSTATSGVFFIAAWTIVKAYFGCYVRLGNKL